MGRRAVGVVVGICVLSGAACDRAAPLLRTGPDIAGVRFPAPDSVDHGVMDVGPVPTAGTGREVPRTTPGGLRLTLDRCELRAPGEWLVTGRVAVPRGGHAVTATLNLGFQNGDLGRSTWAHRVTFARSGHFAVAVPGPPPPGGDPPRPSDDGVGNCDAWILAASAPVATQGAFVAPTARRAPFVYLAPVGSIQAFGSGAPLGKPNDPRTISLYTVWSGARSPITTVYVPVVPGERPALVSMGAADNPCSKISVTVGPADGDPANQVTVTTRSGCGAPTDGDQSVVETHEPVAGAHGYTWARPADHGDPEVARRSIGNIDIWVQGGTSVARSTVAHIAATLTTAANVALATEPAPRRPARLDAAVAGYLGQHPGLTERARFPYRGGWVIVVEDGAGSKPDTPWDYRLLRAGHIATGWWIDSSLGGGGGQRRCVLGPSYWGNAGQDGYEFSIAGNPHWRIQGFIDGKWQTVPTINGVEFEDATVPHPGAFPVRERPVDGTGHVPACFVG